VSRNRTSNAKSVINKTGDVTLIHDTISLGCADTGFETSNGFDQGGGVQVIPTPTPAPATLLLLGFGLAGLLALRKRLLPAA
jgi:hypothetical protein